MQNNNIKIINTKNLKILSKRKNSITYISEDEKNIIKFETTNKKIDLAKCEKNKKITDIINSLGITTPIIKNIIKNEDGNIGYEFENVKNKISFSRAVSENPEKVEEYMYKLSNFVKSIHNKNYDEKELDSIYDLIIKILNENENIFNEERKQKIFLILEKIKKENKNNKILHLDCQPGNYIISNDKIYMIDLESVCVGNPIFDLGLFYYLYHNIKEESTKNLSHCEKNVSELMWRFFIKHYFNFTNEKQIDDFNEYIKPFSLISAIAEYNYVPMPHIIEFINKNFEKIIF